MAKKVYLFCSLILFYTHLFAQEEDIEITPILFENINEVSSITGMAQDNKGHLWMTTSETGLIKYDGKNKVYFRPEPGNTNSISDAGLADLLIDQNGVIWIATITQGLDKLDPETGKFTHYTHDSNNPNSIKSNVVTSILEDEEGFLWIGTGAGLNKFDPSTGEFVPIFNDDPDAETLDKEHIRTLYLDSKGVIWIGKSKPFNKEASQGGLISYNRKTGEIVRYLHTEENNSLIDNMVTAIFEDSRGVFWVGTGGDGLHTMDREKGTFTRHQYDPNKPQKLSRPPLKINEYYAASHIRFINEDEKGNIWIGTFANGINRYNPNTHIVNYYGQDEFKINGFWNSLKTKDGLLWVSSWYPTSGDEVLFKINSSPKKIDFLDLESRAYSFLENEDGSFYIGTNDGLVYLDTNGSVESIFLYDQKKSEERNWVFHLRKDDLGNLWAHTFKGLYIYNPDTKKVINSYHHDPNNKQSISSDLVHKSIQINENTVIVGTGNGLNVLDLETETFKWYFHDPENLSSISESLVFQLAKDGEGNIWVGTRNAGLNLFDLEKGDFKKYPNLATVFEIFEDSKGRLWLGQRGSGLQKYDKEKDAFEPFLDNTGLVNSFMSVFGITEDHDGLLWLNTSVGYISLNPENGDSFLFGESWGVNVSTNDSNNGYTSTNGDVLFGYGDGFFQFKPEKYKEENEFNPSPFIAKIFVDNQALVVGESGILQRPLSETTQITLDYFQNNFALDYGYINYETSTSEHQVVYKLENYEDTWRNSSGDNKAAYYQVDPGNYVFRIRASNSNGSWEEKAINIIILSPWYQTWWAYTLFILLVAGFIRGFVLYRSRKLKAENKILEEKVEERTAELKASQAQLVQSEKMASLGELTAGIAHEIQNPLNFVNNFSEVSGELIEEANEELENGEIVETKEILNDLKQNLQKINHHGNRASSIVKGMLEHSQTSSGDKVLTDINALADEYLRLAYHGLRSKDKDFQSDFNTEFDEKLPKVNVIPQDIGRVLLNLINNSFQACAERSLIAAKAPQPPEGGQYKPTVTVSTWLSQDSPFGGRGAAFISVTDNGPGIPDSIKDKIFQPFFTTKETGKGTGLGLSLAYDIVKAHGGEISVESEINTGSEFKIILPLK